MWGNDLLTHKQPKKISNNNKNKAKIILLILDWNPRWKFKHYLLQWILYETPLENLSHIIFFYINSLNQGLMHLFIKWWKYYHRKKYDSELKIRKPYQIPLVPLLNRGRSDRRVVVRVIGWQDHPLWSRVLASAGGWKRSIENYVLCVTTWQVTGT